MNRTVLTIEDQADLRRLIRMTLELEDCEVLEAGDGAEGVSMARLRQPALILLDRMMPLMNGRAVCEALASHAALRKIPVAILTAVNTSPDIDAALASGAKACLVKPFSPGELLRVVDHRIDETSTAA
jgi:CheY-like chemotaxis protein